MTYDEKIDAAYWIAMAAVERAAREEREGRQHAPGVKPDPTTHDAVRKFVRKFGKDRPKTIGRAA